MFYDNAIHLLINFTFWHLFVSVNSLANYLRGYPGLQPGGEDSPHQAALRCPGPAASVTWKWGYPTPPMTPPMTLLMRLPMMPQMTPAPWPLSNLYKERFWTLPEISLHFTWCSPGGWVVVWINQLQTLPQGLVLTFDVDVDPDPDPELDNISNK